MRPGKGIETKGSFLTRSYSQDGKTLDIMDMFDKMGKIKASADKINTGKMLYYGSLGGAAVGGFYLGQGLASSSGSSNVTTGAVIIGISAGVLYFADKYINEGVDLYNSSVGYRKKGHGLRMSVVPGALLAQYDF